MWSRVIVLLALGASLHAQGAFANADFEKGSPGAVPEGWFVPSAFKDYQAVWVGEGCRQGKGCAEIAPRPNAGPTPGNLMQMFDAAPIAASKSATARRSMWRRAGAPDCG